MQSIIKELWYGNIHPQEAGLFNTASYRKLLSDIKQHRTALEETLNAEQQQLFKELTDKQNEFESLAEAEIFNRGFRLGAQMTFEIFQ